MRSVTAAPAPLTLDHDDQGPRGGTPVVLIPGLSATRRHWLGFDRRLARTRRVVAVDNRGAGGSRVPVGPYTTDAMAADVLATLDGLGIERVDVVGTSMGGMIAQTLALRAPDRVRRLVLGCTHHGGPHHVPVSAEVVALFTPGSGAARRTGPEAVVRRLLELNLASSFVEAHPEVLDELVRMGLERRMHPAGLFGQITAITSFDVEARLPAIATPTLVVAGEDDAFLPSANSRLVAARIPGAVLEMLPGSGHMFWVDAADAAFDIVTRFLDT